MTVSLPVQLPQLSPLGGSPVELEPLQTFWDDFGNSTATGLDTTNRWNSVVSSGAGTSTYTQGALILNSGSTTLGSYAYITTQTAFQGKNPGWVKFQGNINIEFPVLTAAYRYWGFGNISSAPTSLAPVVDGVGFEVSSNATMRCVAYSGSVKTVISDISSQGSNVQPRDANAHRYLIYYRGDTTYYAIDAETNVVGSFLTGAPGPLTNVLPALHFTAASTSTLPSTGAILQMNALAVSDTARGGMTMRDATYAWRGVQVDRNAAALQAIRPIDVTPFGSFSKGMTTGTMTAGLGASSPVFALRTSSVATSSVAGSWLIRRVTVSAANAGTAFAAGAGIINLYPARSFTTALSSGTAGTISSNTGKLKTGFATTTVSDIRIAAAGALTSGVYTLDADPVAVMSFGVSTVAGAALVNPGTILYEPKTGEYPLTLGSNEGFVVNATVPATGTWQMSLWVDYDEVATASF